MSTARRLPNGAYTIAWICALSIELTAAKAVLDEIHSRGVTYPGDDNSYTLGQIRKHNVVLVCLPSGEYGTINAAAVTATIKTTFRSVEYYLLVGIAGGIPSIRPDMRLGDVVVSKPNGIFSGVVQYDMGKTVGGKFQRGGNLDGPAQALLIAMGSLQSEPDGTGAEKTQEYLDEVYDTQWDRLGEKFAYQGIENDILYNPDYNCETNHESLDKVDCQDCDPYEIKRDRKERETTGPAVFYGTIASGNQVVKDAEMRDILGREHGAICFEMEAAGLMNRLHPIVIRGICDYSDSHKNKRWQPYAALTAAAYAKGFLEHLAPHAPSHHTEVISNIPMLLHRNFSGRQEYIQKIRNAFYPRGSHRNTIVSVFGIPGVGKSQICLKYVDIHESDYTCTFYAAASTMKQWFDSCSDIAHTLDLVEAKEDHPEKHLKAVKRWLSQARNSGWIIIVDDVTLETVRSLRETFSNTLRGDVLLSTRFRKIANQFSKMADNRVEIHPMSATEGQKLVLDIYEQPDQNSHSFTDAVIGEICTELGNLPLTLEQVATCAKERLWDPPFLLEKLRKDKWAVIRTAADENSHHVDFLETLDLELESLKADHYTVLNLILTMRSSGLPFEILIDGGAELRSLVPEADVHNISTNSLGEIESMMTVRQLKRSMTSFRGFWFKSLREQLQSRTKLEDAIIALEASSFIRRGNAGEVFTHSLVREYLIGKLGDQDKWDFMCYAEQVIGAALPILWDPSWVEPSSEKLQKFKKYLPYALEIRSFMDTNELSSKTAQGLYEKIAGYLFESSKCDDYIDSIQRVLDQSLRTFGRYHQAVNMALPLVAGHCAQMRKPPVRELDFPDFSDKDMMDEQNTEYLIVVEFLVIVEALGYGGDPQKAVELCDTLISIFEKLEYEDLNTWSIQIYKLTHVKTIYLCRQGDFETALELYDESFEDLKISLEHSPEEFLRAELELVAILGMQKEFEKGEQRIVEMIMGLERLLQPHTSQTILAYFFGAAIMAHATQDGFGANMQRMCKKYAQNILYT